MPLADKSHIPRLLAVLGAAIAVVVLWGRLASPWIWVVAGVLVVAAAIATYHLVFDRRDDSTNIRKHRRRSMIVASSAGALVLAIVLVPAVLTTPTTFADAAWHDEGPLANGVHVVHNDEYGYLIYTSHHGHGPDRVIVAETGAVLGEFERSPDDRLLFASDGATFFLVDSVKTTTTAYDVDGRVLWHADGRAAAADGGIVVLEKASYGSGQDWQLVGLDRDTGDPLWETTTVPPESSVAAATTAGRVDDSPESFFSQALLPRTWYVRDEAATYQLDLQSGQPIGTGVPPLLSGGALSYTVVGEDSLWLPSPTAGGASIVQLRDGAVAGQTPPLPEGHGEWRVVGERVFANTGLGELAQWITAAPGDPTWTDLGYLGGAFGYTDAGDGIIIDDAQGTLTGRTPSGKVLWSRDYDSDDTRFGYWLSDQSLAVTLTDARHPLASSRPARVQTIDPRTGEVRAEAAVRGHDEPVPFGDGCAVVSDTDPQRNDALGFVLTP